MYARQVVEMASIAGAIQQRRQDVQWMGVCPGTAGCMFNCSSAWRG
jgi:hypothetical protein